MMKMIQSPFRQATGSDNPWGLTGAGRWLERPYKSLCPTRVRKLKMADGDGRLGSAVAMASRTAVIGAPSCYDSQIDDPGSVYIAVYDTIWETWFGKFSATGDDGNDFFGTSVAIDDGIAVAGASTVTVDGNDWAGKAYVFTRDSSNQDTGQWSQETVLDAGSNAGHALIRQFSGGGRLHHRCRGTGGRYLHWRSLCVYQKFPAPVDPRRQASLPTTPWSRPSMQGFAPNFL